jgi:hypothetical protein
MYGWDHETDAIGMEPARDTPDKRPAWHTAWAGELGDLLMAQVRY